MDEATAARAKDRRKRDDLLAALRLETRLREANPPPPARAEEERRQRYGRIAEILRKVEEGAPEVAYVDEGTAALLRQELERLDRGGHPAVLAGDDAPPTRLLAAERFNTILYCRQWEATVRFYREGLGLPVVAGNDWYVEFRISAVSSLSIADAASATSEDLGAALGITLSWMVTDLAATRERLVAQGLQPSEIRTVWRMRAFTLSDPEGHRVEVWSERHPGDAPL